MLRAELGHGVADFHTGPAGLYDDVSREVLASTTRCGVLLMRSYVVSPLPDKRVSVNTRSHDECWILERCVLYYMMKRSVAWAPAHMALEIFTSYVFILNLYPSVSFEISRKLKRVK